ncbi:uncharacterized protein Tco025E_10227 [Trypanosoma conorhini]|uniref:Uncharacterized protein n=1 Tax=Trypanosoma conorhini TaxID=83891 RepID=A0A422MP69_9TRYP|nr:uncharacterized protein Tco025E_10227 [Trypanosoma conorhini]RNE95026.1 hypothetical protein Tco025E_10227 [Trypanosoma conorhini]
MGRFVVSPTCASCVAHASSLSAVKRAAHPSTRTEPGGVTPGGDGSGSFTGGLLHSSTAAPRHARKTVCQTPIHQSCAPPMLQAVRPPRRGGSGGNNATAAVSSEPLCLAVAGEGADPR